MKEVHAAQHLLRKCLWCATKLARRNPLGKEENIIKGE